MDFGPPSSLSRRGSRLPTVSPLQGRGFQLPLSHRISILSTPEDRRLATTGVGGLGDDAEMDDLLGAGGVNTDEFTLHSPSATVTEAQSPWIAATLDSESRNFLDFLDAQIQSHHPPPSDPISPTARGNAAPGQNALFESLLPPTQHSRIVAAQAFLHILTLATKGLVTVRQDQNWDHDVGFSAIEVAIAIAASGA
jgi:meiotic recombination protein REC8, fungi type